MKQLMAWISVVLTIMFVLTTSAVFAQDACEGNFDCDNGVDGSDATMLKEDFGRSPFNDPCVSCPTDPWCTYP